MGSIQYLKALRRRWPVVLLAVQLATAAAWLVTPREPEPVVYTATHVLIQDPAVAGAGTTIGLEVLALLTSAGEIPAAATERLGSGEPPGLAPQVTATADPETGILSLTSQDHDPARAALVANTYAEETLRYVRAEAEETRQAALSGADQQRRSQEARIRELSLAVAGRLEQIAAAVAPAFLQEALEADAEYQVTLTEREALQGEYSATLRRIEQLSGADVSVAGLHTLQEAVAVPASTGIRPPTSLVARVVIAAVMGLALGFALAVWLDRMDTRLRTRGDAESAFGLPVVAEIPRPARSFPDHAVVVRTDPRSLAAEAYTALRLSLQLMPRWVLSPQPPGSSGPPHPSELAAASRGSRRKPPKVVLVTSASAGEGKTSIVVNLAASFAEIGTRALVLDCDFRNPGAHRYLGSPSYPGVTDFLRRDSEAVSLSSLVQRTGIEGVWIVPSGQQLASLGRALGPGGALVQEATEMADVVIIDAGSMLGANNPAALMPYADAVVIVARSGHTTAQSAGLTRELLGRLEVPVLGVVLVAVPANALSGSPGSPGNGAVHVSPTAGSPLGGEPGGRGA